MPPLSPSTPPGQRAWLSAALKNTEYSRNFMHYEKAEPGRVVPLPSIIELNRRMKKGDAIAEGEIPRRQFYMNAWKFEETLPPVILMSFLALRRDVADIFRRFDLGRGRLHPVDLLEFDRVTLVSRDYEILTPGNAIETLDLPRSTSVMRRVWDDKVTYNFVTPRGKDKPVYVLQPGFSAGPDVWVDPRVIGALFLSDRLQAALKDARFDKAFSLAACAPG